MKYLYIDTSSSYLYSAIATDTELLCEVKKDFGHTLSEEALPEIVEMFTKTNIDPKEINKIIVVNGPGSFTGIRIGITIAKVYAWSLNIPITTISSLSAMALSTTDDLIHIPVLDARRNYVFAAIYDTNMAEILPPQHIKIEILLQKMEGIGPYEIISNDDLEAFPAKKAYDPNFLKIIKYYKNKEPINPHTINPEYLKLTEAEEKNGFWINRKEFI